jgi:hypothetical protein
MCCSDWLARPSPGRKQPHDQTARNTRVRTRVGTRVLEYSSTYSSRSNFVHVCGNVRERTRVLARRQLQVDDASARQARSNTHAVCRGWCERWKCPVTSGSHVGANASARNVQPVRPCALACLAHGSSSTRAQSCRRLGAVHATGVSLSAASYDSAAQASPAMARALRTRDFSRTCAHLSQTKHPSVQADARACTEEW